MTDGRHDTMPAADVDPEHAPPTPRVRSLPDLAVALAQALGINGGTLEGLRTYAERAEIASDERHAEHAQVAELTAREIVGIRTALGSIGAETKMLAAFVEGAGPHLSRTADELVRLEQRIERGEKLAEERHFAVVTKLDILIAAAQANGQLDTRDREEP